MEPTIDRSLSRLADLEEYGHATIQSRMQLQQAPERYDVPWGMS